MQIKLCVQKKKENPKPVCKTVIPRHLGVLGLPEYIHLSYNI